jgi:hypothetical protein
MIDYDRRCARCDTPEFTDEERADAANGYVVLPWFTKVTGGPACWDCLTLEEQRRENQQCERCGAQFFDDGRDSDRGWVWGGVYLCPSCQTPDEAAAKVDRFAELVERGKEIVAAKGEEYPPDLAALAEHEQARVARTKAEIEDLNRRTRDG